MHKYLADSLDADGERSVATPCPVLDLVLQGGHNALPVHAVELAGGVRLLGGPPQPVGALVRPVVEPGTLLVPKRIKLSVNGLELEMLMLVAVDSN